MHVLSRRNVQQVFPEAIHLLKSHGKLRDSRNGKVLAMDTPVTTVYQAPQERVLFWEERDANPFFHLMESMWMLGGANDVKFVAHFAKNMATYSDDGLILNGAYGHRWRNWFQFDQLYQIASELKKNPDCRRQYLSMWDAESDLGDLSKDIPCNVGAAFRIRDNALDMTVYNRSNDIVWGCYGANAVHFSFLQEYIAGLIGINMGRYYQVSNDWHAYLDVFKKVDSLADKNIWLPDTAQTDPYESKHVMPMNMWAGNPAEEFVMTDIQMLLKQVRTGSPVEDLDFNTTFFREVVHPMLEAHTIFRYGGDWYDEAVKILERVYNDYSNDWALAGIEWLGRRQRYQLRAQDDGVPHE